MRAISPRSGAPSEGQEARTGRETNTPMPELPEVETVRAGLAEHLVEARIVRVQVFRRDLRQPVPQGFEEALTGLRVVEVARRAKYLLLHLESGNIVIIHLGMSGRLILREGGKYPIQKHDHLLITLADGRDLVFNDARRFGLVLLTRQEALGTHPLFAALGPEPLSNDFSAAYLAEKLAARSGPVKPALMDQKLVVGVGNIYACEALFRARVHPATPANRCAGQVDGLVKAIRDVLREAIASGGSTLRDYAKASGESGYFQHKFNVYGREKEPCLTCHTPVARMVQTGRSTFFCPSCQKLISMARRKG